MKKYFKLYAVAILVLSAWNANAAVVDFEDLNYNTNLSGSTYAGLTWESGLLGGGFNGNTGFWSVPSSTSNHHPVGTRNITNSWGATFLGISFGALVDVDGAFFSEQGSDDALTTGVRVHGYKNGFEIATTNWFRDIDTSNTWFAMNLTDVDRIVIESESVKSGGGWYGMDNFTYSVVPVPAAVWLFGSGLIGLIGVAKRK